MRFRLQAILVGVLVISAVPQGGQAQTSPRVRIETRTEDALIITSTSNHTWRIGPNSGSGLGFGFYDEMAGATRLKIDLVGNVGIGTDSPQTRLDVSGAIRSASGGFVFPDGTVQSTAATGGYSAGAGLTLAGNTLSVSSGGINSTMLADGAVQSSDIADGAITAQKLSAELVGGVQKVVRGVIVFDGNARDVSQTLSSTVDPAKSYVIVGSPVLSYNTLTPTHMASTLIDLTATSITIAIGYYAVPCRVGYQVIQFK